MVTYARRHTDSSWKGERPWPAVKLPPGVREEDQFHHERRTISLPVLKRESILVIGGIIVVVMIAVLIAAFVAKWMTVPALLLTIFFVAAYIGLLTIPVWAAALVDDLEDHADELAESAGDSDAD